MKITKTLKIGFAVWQNQPRKLHLGEKKKVDDYVDLGDLDFSDLDFDSLRNTYGSPASSTLNTPLT